MIKLKIKPLSNNEMYGGRKVKSYKYRNFERAIMPLLPEDVEIPKGKIHLNLIVGLSSKLADLDNTLKPFIDCLQLKYGFNDKWIYKISAKKKDVVKGKEYIHFELKETKK
jgi:Holliday junction resolvase RusA-like endonuclease